MKRYTVYILAFLTLNGLFAPLSEGGEWTKKADIPTERLDFSTSVVNRKIYAIGGWTDPAIVSAVEEYDPVADKWTKKEGMPTARSGLSTCAVSGKIYAIGGWAGGGIELSTVEEYDAVTDKWTKKTDMPTARTGLSTGVLNGKIYAIGGFSVGGIALSAVEEYDTGFAGKSVEPTGKLTTTWGKVKAGL